MNMLNLAKRVKLQYLKASFFQLKGERKLIYKRDIAALIEGAVQVHNIAIKIKAPDMHYGYFLFDADFSNSVREADFNREILDFIMDNKKYFQLTEDGFEAMLKTDMENRRAAYLKGVKSVSVAPPVAAPRSIDRTLSNSEKTFACIDLLEEAGLDYYDRKTFAQAFDTVNQCRVFATCLEDAGKVGLDYYDRKTTCSKEYGP
jgi:hypothetical protein